MYVIKRYVNNHGFYQESKLALCLAYINSINQYIYIA